ncbi:DNA cytosine methyltransferase [Nocardioides sp.]|uniref:DNA cytosine methyltransferase n=1 Tax=Nocardioides sp. TaxID=35761 RepID=UPI003515B8B7
MTGLRVVGLFAGVGGIEKGLHHAGHTTELLCEWDAAAQNVLREHFTDVEVVGDVRDLKSLPSVDLLAAGFPCTDISQAGRKTGIEGEQSGLVGEVWRLMDSASPSPEWLLLENVSYLLSLDRGNGLKHLIDSVEARGYRWAYRIVDARAFGLPQRRQRIVFLASRSNDPAAVLFADDAGLAAGFNDAVGDVDPSGAYGFYWTEGLRGLGWAYNAVPTIKGGSGLGIPSPPAIWYPNTGEFGTPQIEDAERMQGFPPDWTAKGSLEAARSGNASGPRWKQVGNAVCVPMSTWVGERLLQPGEVASDVVGEEFRGPKWPLAAFGHAGRSWRANVSTQPFAQPFDIRKFLDLPLKPLSHRAASGFLSRAERGNLRFSHGFIDSLREYIESVTPT